MCKCKGKEMEDIYQREYVRCEGYERGGGEGGGGGGGKQPNLYELY